MRHSRPGDAAPGSGASAFRWREVTGLCFASTALGATASAQAVPDADAASDARTAEQIHVIGQINPGGLGKLSDILLNTPQSIDVITQTAMRQQAATNLQDALRYAPGITLNSGEGGAHGDNVNLRGFSAIDSLFLDGIRDPGSYTRDSFDLQSLEVLQGPSSVLFGNGSAGGVVNQTSKQPSLTSLRAAGLEFGTNEEARGTVDIDQPIGPNAAIRVNLMGETTGVAERDYVQQRRWGVAPTLALGLNTPTRLTLAYFHQEENNVPDYGIPFLFGQPAPVDRSLYYGLKDVDITQTNVSIGTAVLTHDFSSRLSVTNTLRYASYWSNYRVSAPIFGNDSAGGPPAPGTPLADIPVYRDQPSSGGTQTYFTDHADLTGRLDTGPLTHTAITGVEVGRQTTYYSRFDNGAEGVDGVAPTPLLSPDAYEAGAGQNSIVATPSTTADMIAVYATDQIGITSKISLDLGVRYDHYDTKFNDTLNDASFHRVDSAVSPKAALVFKPTAEQTYYVAYTQSFDPASSYLTLAPDRNGPAPQKAKTYEVGAKLRWLGGRLTTTASAFRIEATNITVSDPDDPELQETAGSNQRVQGVELTTTGHLTRTLEITANYQFIDPEITSSRLPAEDGKRIPGAARHVANLWTVYEPNETWQVGTGMNYVGHRYADTLNIANVPGYAVWNAMLAYRVNPRIRLQLNIQNITDARYFTGAYYTDDNENHVLPGQGRVATLNTGFSF